MILTGFECWGGWGYQNSLTAQYNSRYKRASILFSCSCSFDCRIYRCCLIKNPIPPLYNPQITPIYAQAKPLNPEAQTFNPKPEVNLRTLTGSAECLGQETLNPCLGLRVSVLGFRVPKTSIWGLVLWMDLRSGFKESSPSTVLYSRGSTLDP